MRYEILSSPMPIKDFVVELRVADNGDGTTTVVWGGDFQVTSADETTMAERIQGFLWLVGEPQAKVPLMIVPHETLCLSYDFDDGGTRLRWDGTFGVSKAV
jgi:hypothetical protein